MNSIFQIDFTSLGFAYVALPSDLFIFSSIISTFLFFLWARKKEYYREAWRRVKQQPTAIICIFILMIYGFVTVCDSIHYRLARTNDDLTMRVDKNGQMICHNVRSLFDTLVASVYSGIKDENDIIEISIERTYSKPFAEQSFDKKKNRDTGKWEYEKLNAGGTHILGTDKSGGDIFYKLLKGTRTALVVGLIATMIVIPFAIIFGICAGFFGGWIDDTIQFIYVTLSSIPSILLISAVMLICHAKMDSNSSVESFIKDDSKVILLCVILGLVSWSSLCRLLRAETLKLKETDYVKAAKVLGVNSFSIIAKHIVPNVLHVILIRSILSFSGLVMVEAILAYIRIGVPDNVYSWGRVVNNAREQIARDPIIWWPVVGAFIFMFVLVLCVNILGDAIRDALDPKLRK
jgi:peptide/nickel transport system permease protein